MIRVEREIEVERSASEVFDRLIRIEDLPRWQPAISEAIKEIYADGTIKTLAAKWAVPDTNLTETPGA